MLLALEFGSFDFLGASAVALLTVEGLSQYLAFPNRHSRSFGPPFEGMLAKVWGRNTGNNTIKHDCRLTTRSE